MNIGIHQDYNRPVVAQELSLCESGGRLFASLEIVESTGQGMTFFFHDPDQARAIGEQFIKLADMYAEKLLTEKPVAQVS